MPKKATSKPNITSLVFFIIIVTIYVSNTLLAGVQVFIAICFAPLAIIGLFLAYNSGIALAKYNYSRVAKNDIKISLYDCKGFNRHLQITK
ncbi:hypothetical protein J6S55_00425 [Candidatus Saccharibacteria bacterium]|nr:hypothetical protein [Candidatus Saccharibacteria bacterium]